MPNLWELTDEQLAEYLNDPAFIAENREADRVASGLLARQIDLNIDNDEEGD